MSLMTDMLIKIPANHLCHCLSGLQDVRFKQFPNGTLRINSVEVYDKHIQYMCMIANQAGRLTAFASVFVLGKGLCFYT